MVRRTANKTQENDNAKQDFTNGAKEVIDVLVPQFMYDTRLPYAWSVIRDRALIDSRDGLRPVQRKILWTLYQDKVTPNSEYVKVARLAGNVLRFHPHGNTSVEEALDHMAQEFSLRVPLIDGKGSFGAHPGDQPAAARYIEARLNKAAMELLDDIKYGTVEMTKNFDDTLDEPVYLPVRWPLSVINGDSGIAVGYASKMAQHNPTEVLKVCKLLLKNPNATTKQIMRIMPGPDFWTGGIVYGVDGIKDYFETGKGTFIVRSKYKMEPLGRGRMLITFYELPPGVSCESVLEDVHKKISNGNQLLKSSIGRIDDLTGRVNTNDVRLIIETKAGSNPQLLLAELFKSTPLQQSFSVNNTVISNNMPVQMGIKGLIMDFLNLRKHCVLTRSANFKLKKQARIHEIDGLLSILMDIDKAISIIRKSDSQTDARDALMKSFKIDEGQANYVLDMQLRRLTRQDSTALESERKQLEQDIIELDKVINDEEELKKVILTELDKEAKIIGRPRLMEISDLTLEEAKNQERENTSTAKANNRDTKAYLYTTADNKVIKSSVKLPMLAQAREDNGLKLQPYANMAMTTNQAKLGVYGSNGVEYSANMNYLTEGMETTPTGLGVVPTGVKQVAVIPDEEDKVLVVTHEGKLRVVSVEPNDKWTERPVVQLDKGDTIVSAVSMKKMVRNSTAIIITAKGRVIRFTLDDINPVSMGAKLIKGMGLQPGDSVAAVVVARPDAVNLITTSKHTVKVTPIEDIPVNGRGGKGSILHPLVGNDTITDASIDGMLVKNGKSVNLPAPSPRNGRSAPVPPASKLLSV